MPAADNRGSAPAISRRWHALAVAALLAAYAAMAFTATLTKGLTFDEGEQIAVGYNIWLRGDLRIEGANGDLIKRWATLPFLLSRPNFVGTDDPTWRTASPYELAYRFFFQIGNRPESLLRQTRAMVVLLGVITGWLVFACARHIFGPAGGLVALGLYAFSPMMLAFGGVVSTDMSITLTLFAATWSIWRLLHEITLGRVLASLAWFGLLLLAKMTALVIFPLTAVLLVVKFAARTPLVLRWLTRSHTIASRRTQAAIIAGLVALHAFAGWSAIWAHYGFRFAASPNPVDAGIEMRKQVARDGIIPPGPTAIVDWSRRHHFLPQGYLAGIDWLLGDDDRLPAFMNGRWTAGGWRAFFPYAIWVKTRPALFLLLVLAAAAWWHARRRSAPAGPAAPTLYAATPCLALIAVYLAVAVTQEINLGHRHVMPIYPALYVLAGAAALAWPRWRRIGQVTVVALIGWGAVDSFTVRPHYLAYFGPQVGGPDQGYRHLVDSSLDWGANLPGLKRWLERHNPGDREPVFLGYFGTDSPDYYGIKAWRLPGFFDWRPSGLFPLTPGYYAISATLLQSVYSAAFGPWNREYERLYRSALASVLEYEREERDPARKQALLAREPAGYWEQEFVRYDRLRFARLCAWLRHQGDPPNHVGHAIFIWKLDFAALQAALEGPPVELLDAPVAWLGPPLAARPQP